MSKRAVARRTRDVPTQEPLCEVRSVWRVAGLKPYGWQIIDAITGAPVAESTELYRKSGEAWSAGVEALHAGSREGVLQRYGMPAERPSADCN